MRILIADDHDIVRKGLKLILMERYPDGYFLEAGDGEELVAKAKEMDWDIIISDISMPHKTGLQALKEIKEIKPQIPILILSIYSEDLYATRAMKMGAHGYVTKDLAEEELVKAIETVLQGKKFISPTVAEKLANSLVNEVADISHKNLSDREMDVFKLLAEGQSIAAIAQLLSLNASTVSTYRSRILEKMNMKSNADIVRYALENKLV
ncbi:MAG: response regulator transcription factor [Chitinophagaceae bacterium]|nr:response regulator transcription factor [Chitinophagaceae bacterium]